MDGDIYRRLEKLESTDDSMRLALNQLVINTTIMNDNLEKLSYLEPRVRRIEDDQATSKMIITSIRWAGGIVLGTMLTIATAAFMSNYFTVGG